MSCFAGLIHLGGERVDVALIHGMSAAMTRRAPDGTQTYCQGAVGLVQDFLRTGGSGAEQPNALTLNGEVYIVADVRLDDRARLLRELRGCGRVVLGDAPHAELILHAYEAFGDRFVEHLLGDFAFAIWDARKQALVCARDPLGIRPLHLARHGEWFAFASDLEALRTLPWISSRIDKYTAADFLMFGTCSETERTIYEDIKRLAPATLLRMEQRQLSQARYWQVPQRETRYRSSGEYVELFREIFQEAVSDRMPAGAVAVHLSGGMDSTSIAAVAAPHAARRGFAVTGYHMSCRRLIPDDQEQPLAERVAARLGIPMVAQDLSDRPLLHDNRNPELRTPFPFTSGHLAVHRETLDLIEQSGARVLLGGYAGDAVFTPWGSYLRRLFRSGRWVKFTAEIAHQLLNTKTLAGSGVRNVLLHDPHPLPDWRPAMPRWLAPELVESLDLPQRWENWWRRFHDAVDPGEQLLLPWADRAFEVAEILPRPVVVRYPFLDLRLVEYLFSVPNFMLQGKRLLRAAMQGRLPAEILDRPKAALPGDPIRRMFERGNLDSAVLEYGAGRSPAIDEGAHWAALQSYRAGAGTESTWPSALILLPFAFADWIAKAGASYE